MAMKMTHQQTPEMLGFDAEQLQAISAAGGKIELPPAARYIRFGGVSFPRARHLLILWEVWPDKKAAQERSGKYVKVEWLICPEPNVLVRELQAESGEVLQPARVLPTFDQVMSLAQSSGDTAAAAFESVKKVAYAIAETWPDFAGAEKV